MGLVWLSTCFAAVGIASIGVQHAAEEAMPTRARAITMAIAREDGMIVVKVMGRSEVPKLVRFEIEVDGRSTTRNVARNMVGPIPKTLSVVRFADIPPWHITLDVNEADAVHYKESASNAMFD
jgi:hypothetical protein